MANKMKVGLDYFPMETDFFNDRKTKKLIRAHGGASVIVYMNLLTEIYKNGYYLKWDDDIPGNISDVTRLDESFINQVIDGCFQVDLFNKEMFDVNKIITSIGIQTRYELICKTSKRKAIVSEFSLIHSEQLEIDPEELLQRKGKEIKGNKRKGNERKHPDETSSPSRSYESEKKELDELASSLEKDVCWLEVVAMKENKTIDEIKNLIPVFKNHCITIRTGKKTEKDFAEHFMNWCRKSKNIAVNGQRNPAGFPDHWDQQLEKKLSGPELSAYWQHLRSLGLVPKKNRFQVTTDWIPAASQVKA